MSRNRRWGVFAAFAGLLIGTLVVAVAIGASEAPKAVRIIYTNDTYGYLEGCG